MITEKFQDRYRIPSARLQNWNYQWSAAYFITICTKYRQHFFGEIENGMMILNEIGEMVCTEWVRTLKIRPDMNLKLGEFVVMPNHFHGILIIGNNQYNGCDAMGGDDAMNDYNAIRCRDAMHCVSTSIKTSINTTTPTITPTANPTVNQFGPQRKNVSSVIRGFKSSVTSNARLINLDFEWQSRFHDHIIRDAREFETISSYIINNPQHWQQDTFNGTL